MHVTTLLRRRGIPYALRDASRPPSRYGHQLAASGPRGIKQPPHCRVPWLTRQEGKNPNRITKPKNTQKQNTNPPPPPYTKTRARAYGELDTHFANSKEKTPNCLYCETEIEPRGGQVMKKEAVRKQNTQQSTTGNKLKIGQERGYKIVFFFRV
jgi:hypothetical protein